MFDLSERTEKIVKTANGRTLAAVAAGATAAAVAGVAVLRKHRGHVAVLEVHPDGEGWKLAVEGKSRSAMRFDTKEEAVAAGRAMAHDRAPSELVIHRSDDSEQDRHHYDENA